MSNRARRHHVVSKFYLRYFADADEQVATVALPGDTRFRQSITSATVRKDYYSIIDNQGNESDLVEREAFGGIEAAASEVWREVADGCWPLTGAQRGNMAGWLGLQLLRGNGVRDSMNQIGTHGLILDVILGGRQKIRDAYQRFGEAIDDASVDREWVEFFRNPYRIEVHANHHVEYIGNALPKVVDALLDRWWLLTVFDRKALATSDHPVYVVPDDDLTRLGMGTGILNAHEIYAPLTRRLGLTMARRDTLPPEIASLRHDGQSSGVTATALYSNSCMVNSARRFLFHHPADNPLAGLDLPPPRDRETTVSADPWSWLSEDDREVLVRAGIGPDDIQALLR